MPALKQNELNRVDEKLSHGNISRITCASNGYHNLRRQIISVHERLCSVTKRVYPPIMFC